MRDQTTWETTLDRDPNRDNAGDFAGWVEPYLGAMANLAARLAGSADRDDVVQEALMRAWRRRTTYDVTRGTPRSWLLAIVADQARRLTRRRTAHRLDPPPPRRPPDDDLDLEAAIRRLPDRQRLAITLFYFVDLPVAEVALVMGCSVGTVKATLAQARGRLEQILEVRT